MAEKPFEYINCEGCGVRVIVGLIRCGNCGKPTASYDSYKSKGLSMKRPTPPPEPIDGDVAELLDGADPEFDLEEGSTKRDIYGGPAKPKEPSTED